MGRQNQNTKTKKSTGDRRPALAGRGRPRRYLKIDQIDYRDIETLKRFISERGKIRSRRVTGASRRQQRLIARAVKRARELALLPYVTEGEETDRRGRRDRDRDR